MKYEEYSELPYRVSNHFGHFRYSLYELLEKIIANKKNRQPLSDNYIRLRGMHDGIKPCLKELTKEQEFEDKNKPDFIREFIKAGNNVEADLMKNIHVGFMDYRGEVVHYLYYMEQKEEIKLRTLTGHIHPDVHAAWHEAVRKLGVKSEYLYLLAISKILNDSGVAISSDGEKWMNEQLAESTPKKRGPLPGTTYQKRKDKAPAQGD